MDKIRILLKQVDEVIAQENSMKEYTRRVHSRHALRYSE